MLLTVISAASTTTCMNNVQIKSKRNEILKLFHEVYYNQNAKIWNLEFSMTVLLSELETDTQIIHCYC